MFIYFGLIIGICGYKSSLVKNWVAVKIHEAREIDDRLIFQSWITTQ